MGASPSLRLERRYLQEGARIVAGMDEVGRGALSGPVTVGVVLVDSSRRALSGVRDSKLLTPRAREESAPRIRRWAVDSAVGHAEAWEIDERGIIGALRLAGVRALMLLQQSPDLILLDGSHDWLTPPSQQDLFDETAAVPPVVTKVKGDLTCTSIAAASVLAKTERDHIMVALDERHPGYAWADNKGYASAEHVAGLETHGVSVEHRRSWHLPGVESSE